MVLPTFLVVGAMKSGTTSLHRQLAAQPDVYVPRLKEVEFFSEPAYWGRGLAWYESLFADGAHAAARGEVSTGYTKFPRYPETPRRIHDVVPDVALVYLVRDPIERIRSHYQHNVLQGLERESIENAVHPESNYVWVSRYATQIGRYLELFPRDRVLIVFTEDLAERRDETLAAVLRHIGASDHVDTLDTARHHATSERRRLRPGLRWVRRSPLYEWARRSAPLSVQRVAARALGSRTGDLPSLPSQLRSRLHDELAGEVAAIEALTGRLPDSWLVH